MPRMAGLRRVQDRRRHQRAVDAAIGDGEGAALHLVDLELAVAGAAAEIGDALFDLGDRLLVAVAHHRHHQALVGADGDADVIIILVDQVGAVDLGIGRRNVLQRLHAGLGEEAHKSQFAAVLLLEHVLVLRAHRHDVAHVDLVEGRQHRRGVLHVLQAARDGLAQPRHLHPLFARGIVGGRRRAHLHRGGRLIDRRRRRGGLLDRGQHVALGDAAILAGAGNGRGIDAAFGRNLAHRRRQRRVGRRRLGRAGRGAAARAAAAAAAAALAGAAAGLAAAPAAPSLICPSSAPTATVSPSLATISPSMPADGAGTSIVTLSVSSSTSGSSTATASPAFLNQRPMVASVTDSPSVGTRISVMVCFLKCPVRILAVIAPRKRSDPVIRDGPD